MDNTPLNLKITRYDESSSRFSSAIWFNEIQKQNVTVAGVGGIGSFVAFLLSRVKPNTITVYDPDYVDSTNMAGQFYNASQIGISKIAAIVENIHNFSSYYSVNSFILKFTEHSIWDKILICGFDKDVIKSLTFQLITGSIVLPKESKLDVDKWMKTMESIFDKRFGNTDEGFDDFKEWANGYIEFICYNAKDKNLEDSGLLEDEIASVCANSLMD